MSLEMDFCCSTELSMFDLMGWAFLALLSDYTLATLLIMVHFLGSNENHGALAYICFHVGVRNGVGEWGEKFDITALKPEGSSIR